MDFNKDTVDKFLKELGIYYEKDVDEKENALLYYMKFKSEDTNIYYNLMLINNLEKESLIFYVPEILRMPEGKEDDVLRALNILNSSMLYGNYFYREDTEYISYRNGHSLEGREEGIVIEQFEDYLGMLDYAVDRIVEVIGMINDNE
ncbi:YbjN domain-containing protein [Niameybacter massiliensis]|uniref:YbjN domain-containing protein n=1 Tax=Holtiella tumoricola TaxID=3018743 RepID=A0AA42J2Q2_9FIRM|nr:YbjN domain-containing protein [Holtiella tumoricola]MDA3734029.1 YbjN domain-containing protein [Holtiella tumoricola]